MTTDGVVIGVSSDTTNRKQKNILKYHNKQTDLKLYTKMKTIHDKYTTEARLRELWHPYDSQKNESINKRISKYAPKDREYSRSMSLTNRVAIALGVTSVGYLQYWLAVSLVLGIHQGHVSKASWTHQESRRQYLVKYRKKRK